MCALWRLVVVVVLVCSNWEGLEEMTNEDTDGTGV